MSIHDFRISSLSLTWFNQHVELSISILIWYIIWDFSEQLFVKNYTNNMQTTLYANDIGS